LGAEHRPVLGQFIGYVRGSGPDRARPPKARRTDWDTERRRIAIDRDGLVVEALTNETAVVTPAHEYPLGVTLSSARRVELVSWASGL
jgi:GntR family transcriptional regulator/MocR family aminotransferase